MEIINYVSFAIGTFGAIIIIWGTLISALRFCLLEFQRSIHKKLDIERQHIRHFLSFYLLMGLEYMIGADIIRTIIRPTVEELVVLGSMVAIRTVISFFLNKEIQDQ